MPRFAPASSNRCEPLTFAPVTGSVRSYFTVPAYGPMQWPAVSTHWGWISVPRQLRPPVSLM